MRRNDVIVDLIDFVLKVKFDELMEKSIEDPKYALNATGVWLAIELLKDSMDKD